MTGATAIRKFFCRIFDYKTIRFTCNHSQHRVAAENFFVVMHHSVVAGKSFLAAAVNFIVGNDSAAIWRIAPQEQGCLAGR